MQVNNRVDQARFARLLYCLALICVNIGASVLPSMSLTDAQPRVFTGIGARTMKADNSAGSKRKKPVERKKVERRKTGAHAAGRPHRRAASVRQSGSGVAPDPRNEFSEDEWRDMVATAAYFRAEARGFEGGSSDEDWYEAEAELRERFSSGDDRIETPSNSGGGATDIETTGE